MGMQEGGGAAGWFNRYTERFFPLEVTARQQHDIALADLKARLAEMAQNPAQTAAFFREKFCSQWMEPTMGMLWNGALSEHTGAFGETAARFFAKDHTALETLLGRRLRISPSQLEKYYTCRYGYFLQYVLGLRPRKRAELSADQSGTLMHWVLQMALDPHPGPDNPCAGLRPFLDLDDEAMAALAGLLVDEYAKRYLPKDNQWNVVSAIHHRWQTCHDGRSGKTSCH